MSCGVLSLGGAGQSATPAVKKRKKRALSVPSRVQSSSDSVNVSVSVTVSRSSVTLCHS